MQPRLHHRAGHRPVKPGEGGSRPRAASSQRRQESRHAGAALPSACPGQTIRRAPPALHAAADRLALQAARRAAGRAGSCAPRLDGRHSRVARGLHRRVKPQPVPPNVQALPGAASRFHGAQSVPSLCKALPGGSAGSRRFAREGPLRRAGHRSVGVNHRAVRRSSCRQKRRPRSRPSRRVCGHVPGAPAVSARTLWRGGRSSVVRGGNASRLRGRGSAPRPGHAACRATAV
mmetsp:Transcript_14684/g.55327  ORF Transcript_14684/g.55327 Transcript_14684/m.55327 type:complete len:232 (+) Transcript_14684:83-778(+)